MRELDGLKVWDGFGLFSFTFKIADSEQSSFKRSSKIRFIFPNHTFAPYDKDTKYTSWFFSSTLLLIEFLFSFTHIHRGIIYRESCTLIPWYLILCNTTHTLATDGSNDSDLTKRNPLTTKIFDISLNKVTSKMCTTKIECYCHRYLGGGGGFFYTK
jgi:hypothetical protein